MNEEEMIHYEDELFEELSKNKIKRTDILIDLNVTLQKYQRLVANIKDAREIQEYKIAVVSVESELKELQQENKELKKQYCERTDCSGRIGNSKKVEELEKRLEASEKARKEAIDKLKTLGKFDGEKCTRSFKLWTADFNELISVLDIDKGE